MGGKVANVGEMRVEEVRENQEKKRMGKLGEGKYGMREMWAVEVVEVREY